MTNKNNNVSRQKSFSTNDDIILSTKYLGASQDSISGMNQSKDQLWARIAKEFNAEMEISGGLCRTDRSLQSRWALITKAVSKFRRCVRQIENRSQSGTNELDTLTQARELFRQDVDGKKVFQYDHVWPILKDCENFAVAGRKRRIIPYSSDGTQLGTPTSSSPRSAFFVNLDADDNQTSTDDSSRPTGRKKEKTRNREDEEKFRELSPIHNQGDEVVEILKMDETERHERYAREDKIFENEHQLEMVKAINEGKKIENERKKMEYTVMQMDIDSIRNPVQREYFRIEQQEILLTRRNIRRGGTSSEVNPNNSNNINQHGGGPGGYGGEFGGTSVAED